VEYLAAGVFIRLPSSKILSACWIALAFEKCQADRHIAKLGQQENTSGWSVVSFSSWTHVSKCPLFDWFITSSHLRASYGFHIKQSHAEKDNLIKV
jgi:hypothetical protein